MNEKQTLEIVNNVFINIFGYNNPFDLDTILSKFAFDLKLPKKVSDSITKEETWSASINATKFITQSNMIKYDKQHGWIFPKKNVRSLNDILDMWKKTNYTTTERIYDCVNVSQSDPAYNCENGYRCTDCSKCKNVIFSDGCVNCNSIIASQRSNTCNFCLRADDSGNCSNSYNVICSNKISNSFFIQDCKDLHECIFCSHIANKEYCISNMQFSKEEYSMIKKEIIKWILNS